MSNAGMWGADVQALSELGKRMTEEGSRMAETAQALNAQLDGTAWQGPDADKFKGEWSSTHHPNLTKAAQALQDAGTAATAQAQAQEQTSQA